MTAITCNSCKKLQPFVERMMYCGFCGTRYTDLEIYNASQRIKQNVIVQRYASAYLWGGISFVLFILPALLVKFVPDVQSHKSISFLSMVILVAIWARRPFAQAHAKKLYPEKSAE